MWMGVIANAMGVEGRKGGKTVTHHRRVGERTPRMRDAGHEARYMSDEDCGTEAQGMRIWRCC